MKTILLPTDFSPTAKHAADFAFSLAQIIEAKLVFLNVIQYVPDTMYNVTEPSSDLYEIAEEKAEISLERFKENALIRFQGDTELYPDGYIAFFPEIETKVVYGNISNTILEIAEELNVDFIVMGMADEKNFLDKIFGSNSLRIAQNANCPVWIIPQETKISTIKKIMYASDLDGNEVEFIQKTIDIAKIIGAKVSAVHIAGELEPNIFPSKQVILQINKALGGSAIHFKNFHSDDVVKGIETYLETNHADALVVAQEHKNWLERLLIKRVISRLTYNATIPVLVLQK